MSNIYKSIERALNTALQTAIPDELIYLENMGGASSGVPELSALPCVTVDFLPTSPVNIEPMDNGKIRHTVIYQVNIFDSQATGKYSIYDIIEKLETVFFRGSILTADNVNVFIKQVYPNPKQYIDNLFFVPYQITCYADNPAS